MTRKEKVKLLGNKPLTRVEISARWRVAHPEGQGKANKKYYKENKGKLLAGKYRWYRDNRSLVLSRRKTPESRKKLSLWKYGVTSEWYDERIKRGCFICGGYIKLGIDHDHSCCSEGRSCGKCVREVLCTKCNAALGLTGENVEILQRLIAYVLLFKKTIEGDDSPKEQRE